MVAGIDPKSEMDLSSNVDDLKSRAWVSFVELYNLPVAM